RTGPAMAGMIQSSLPREPFHVFGLGCFVAVNDLKLDRFSLVQNLVPLPQNRGMVDKNILSGFLGDEAKTASVVEPFHFSAGHHAVPSVSVTRPRAPGTYPDQACL